MMISIASGNKNELEYFRTPLAIIATEPTIIAARKMRKRVDILKKLFRCCWFCW